MEKEEAKLYKDIYNGVVHTRKLPLDLYRAIAKSLMKSVLKGFKLKKSEIGLKDVMNIKTIETPAWELIQNLQTNTYVFSAAKTFQEVKLVQGLMYDELGFKVPFNTFKKEAEKVFTTFNKNYLRVEQDMAWKQSVSARQWLDIQADKDIFEYLKYATAGDDRVRDDHIVLDGITLPVDDPFWDNYMPPNGWSCRCDVIQVEADDVDKPTDLSERDIKPNPELFMMNAGKDGYWLDTKAHPYFTVDKNFEKFKKNNFGLPLPNKI